MTLHIALLRGVNVGGARPVAMADLRAMLTRLGFDDPRSLLQSGNLVFGGSRRTGASLERLLEAEAEKCLQLETSFMVRTAAEWAGIVSANPFTREAARDPSHVAVMCLKEQPAPARLRALHAVITGPEKLSASGRQLYAVYPAGFARTRLTGALVEKMLETRGTGRNWNTVLKLARAAGV